MTYPAAPRAACSPAPTNRQLAGEDGEDEIRGLGAADFIFGGVGNDVIYGGPGDDESLFGDEGDDVIYGGDGDDAVLMGRRGRGRHLRRGWQRLHCTEWGGQRDKLYCGEGQDSYMAEKVDYVSSSCEVKIRPSKSKGIP